MCQLVTAAESHAGQRVTPVKTTGPSLVYHWLRSAAVELHKGLGSKADTRSQRADAHDHRQQPNGDIDVVAALEAKIRVAVNVVETGLAVEGAGRPPVTAASMPRLAIRTPGLGLVSSRIQLSPVLTRSPEA